MQFTVPQFIFREPKIVGPLTFKQFIYVFVAFVIGFVLYLALAKTKFFIFLLGTIFFAVLALVFAFGQYAGKSVMALLTSFAAFMASNKLYLWRKKETPRTIIMERVVIPKPKRFEREPLRISDKSRLRDLATKVETRK